MIEKRRRKNQVTILCLIFILIVSIVAIPLQPSADTTKKPWLNKQLTPNNRADLLVDAMTLEDKANFITGDLNNDYGYYNKGLKKYDIPELKMADGPTGVRIANPNIHNKKSTAMPAPIGLAATWDKSAATKYGNVLGTEAFNTTHNILLGPGLDIARNPFGSRNFESLGEDPLLISEMATSYVKAVQSHHVLTSAKHLLLNNQEKDRFTSDSQASERTINEIYARPFASVMKHANMSSVMCSLNQVNSTYACDNKELLTNLLRHQLGFNGFVMSDYHANVSTAQSINAGLDFETPGNPGGLWGDKLVQAVKDGQVSKNTLDQSVHRVLYQMFDKGLFDFYTQNKGIDVKANGSVARQIAAESMVLLQNKKSELPLNKNKKQQIALIGPDANNGLAAGGGSSLVIPNYTISPLEGIINQVGKNVTVKYVAGTDPISTGDVLPGPDAVPSVFLKPSANSKEHGLKAFYWNNSNMKDEPTYTNTAKQVNLNLGFYNYDGLNAQSPKLDKLPTSLNSAISAKFTGVINVPKSGSYELSTTSYGSSKLFIDGKLVVDNAGKKLGTEKQTVQLEKGKDYPVRIDYRTDYINTNHYNGGQIRFGWKPVNQNVVDSNIKKAIRLAKKSDVAVVITRAYDSEGDVDRSDMELPNNQNQLIKEVAKVNKHVIVVNESGTAVKMGAWKNNVASIIQAWYPGEEQGNAIADILFGKVNPSAKLPVTFPKNAESTPINTEEQYPGVNETTKYTEGVNVGYRGYETDGIKPAFPFGYGLSYTSFKYSNAKITEKKMKKDKNPAFEVAVELQNTGQVKGSEVVQVYTGKLPTKVSTPAKQLAGFKKITLRPGKKRKVTIKLDPKAFSYYDENKHDWVMPSGKVRIYIGSSSADTKLQNSVTVSNSKHYTHEDERSFK